MNNSLLFVMNYLIQWITTLLFLKYYLNDWLKNILFDSKEMSDKVNKRNIYTSIIKTGF